MTDHDPDILPDIPPDYAYEGVLPEGPAHRRGSGVNPTNRFEPVKLHVLGEELDRRLIERAGDDQPRKVERTIYDDRSESIINRVAPTSDVPFNWTLNPYRGCEHGCVYCFARPYHEFLGFSCGLDFETKLIAKRDAPHLLRRELARPRWSAEPIVMSAITDIYQPVEHELRIARQCLEILADCAQPVSTMTKGALVLRDTDLWQKLAEQQAGRVVVTLVTLDADLAKSLEPRAATPAGRLRIIRELSGAGIPVSINVAPIIPGLTDHEIPRLLEAAADHGASRANYSILRLPWQVKTVFSEWLDRHVHPSRKRAVEAALRDAYGGKLYDSDLTKRRGAGKRVEQIRQTFHVFRKRTGLDKNRPDLTGGNFRPPEQGGQQRLFA
ncbi:MAG: PA0069 family radical SAM protein [Planctomycetota bacterium]